MTLGTIYASVRGDCFFYDKFLNVGLDVFTLEVGLEYRHNLIFTNQNRRFIDSQNPPVNFRV